MRKHLIYIFLFFATSVYSQNGQEDNWAKELFEKKYVHQSFEKFKGKISVIDKANIEFDNKILEFWSIKPELLEIFTEGIFYPQIVIGNEKNNPIKSESELKSLTNNERLLYNLKRNDKLRISDFEELPFLSNSPTVKRFRFWNYSFGSMNPEVYFIELINENATEKTELNTFINGAKLTFVQKGWLII